MKLTQLKYLKAIVDNDLNISLASQELHTSQPGVSKQIGLLESELGLEIFERKGRNLSSITDVGQKIMQEVNQMLDVEKKIKAIARDYVDPESGCMNIYTTNTIARFILPKTISYFVEKYPTIPLHVGAAHPTENGMISKRGSSDFSIVAHEVEHHVGLVILPAYEWSLSLIVPADHPLCEGELTLQRIARYPLISYDEGSSGRAVQDIAFGKVGIKPNYFMTVMDTDVIKKYVSMNLGVGIIATIAAKSICDDEIVSIPLAKLIDNGKAWLCFGRNVYLQNHMYDFIEMFSPHLTKNTMETVMKLTNQEIDNLSATFSLPVY